jgi:adenylosuccinate synthase
VIALLVIGDSTTILLPLSCMDDTIQSLQLGQISAVIGAQWGDEGKGKIIDILAENFDIQARAGGGANAGHTIVVGKEKHIFHLLPSGCLYEGKDIVLGSGMVIHLPTLIEEIETLRKVNIDVVPRILISRAAHIVLGYHKKIDAVMEDRRTGSGGKTIGTTMRGIGPTYADKAYRTGLRMGDLIDMSEDELKRFVQNSAVNAQKMFNCSVNSDEELKELLEAKKLLGDRIKDTVTYLQKMYKRGKTILIEGAQGTLLDIDHGTYPNVTSSQTTSTGALHALGLPPQSLKSCIAVVKAYCTRVGSGPFPTEVTGKRGDDLRERGSEYGATTGRPRRCGWLPLHDLERAINLNGYTHINLTKLDVLDAEETIPVYSSDDKFEELKGWQESTKGMTSFADLPEKAQEYIEYIEEKVGIPVSFIGTGPGREEVIMRATQPD